MQTHSFTLILEGATSEEMADALFEAGCDDASLSESCGVTRLEFDRDSETFEAAVTSAIANTQSAGVRVLRIEPDELVTASEAGDRLGQTRQSIQLYSTGARGPGGFPSPIMGVGRRSPLYRWSEIVAWARANLGSDLEAPDTHLIAALNAAIELRRYAPDDALRFLELVSAGKR